MKTTLYSLALLMLVTCALFTACGPSKKLQFSKAQVKQLKKDSIETRHKLDEKNTANKDKTKTSKSTLATFDTKAYKPLPPIVVENSFKSKYASATEVVWTKKMPLVKVKNKDTRYYKADFLMEKNTNSVVYSENGELIEVRAQILADQLPPNIHDAITKKYPNATIVSATTFKNTKINGSYTAIIKAQSEEKEVILMENGTFVE